MHKIIYANCYSLSYLYIFINSFLFLHFALEFARCSYRILQINYVDVDVKQLKKQPEKNLGLNEI